jgi:hypothetical protein
MMREYSLQSRHCYGHKQRYKFKWSSKCQSINNSFSKSWWNMKSECNTKPYCNSALRYKTLMMNILQININMGDLTMKTMLIQCLLNLDTECLIVIIFYLPKTSFNCVTTSKNLYPCSLGCLLQIFEHFIHGSGFSIILESLLITQKWNATLSLRMIS